MALQHFFQTIPLQTTDRLAFTTITQDIVAIIARSGITTGTVLIQSMHTTARLWVNENEKNLIGDTSVTYTPDIHKIVDSFASPQEVYLHNDVKDARNPLGKRDTHLCAPDARGVCHECKNGHAHAQALLFPHSLSFIIKDGKLLKGAWQEIMFVELDCPRFREVAVLVQGE